MSIAPGEITRLRTALHDSSEGASEREKSDFTKRLKGISLDTLRIRLRTRAISTRWKRDLAVAELADRLEEIEGGAPVTTVRKLTTKAWGAWLAAAIIALCCGVIGYAGFSVWTR